MAPKSGIKLNLNRKAKLAKSDARGAQESDVVFTSFNEQKPSFKDLRLICESLDENPGKSRLACEEVIATKTGGTVEAAVNAYRIAKAANVANTGATENSLSVAGGSEKGQKAPKPGKKQPNSATMTEGSASEAIEGDPNGLSVKSLREERNGFGGVPRRQPEDYDKIRMILSKRRREEQARLRLADEERRGRLAAGVGGFNNLAEIPEAYRTTRPTLGGWEYASPRAEAVAHALLGGKEDYGFGEIAEPSVQDVLMLRLNFARYRPDLADPTATIDIVWKQWDMNEARLKEGTIVTSPVVDPEFDFVPRGPGEWRFAEVYAHKPDRSAAEVWRLRQEARARMKRDGTQHLSIEWWPNVPGLYSPRSGAGSNNAQKYGDEETDNNEDHDITGEGASEEDVEEVVAEGDVGAPADAGNISRGKRKGNGRAQRRDTEQRGGSKVTNTKTRRADKTVASNANDTQRPVAEGNKKRKAPTGLDRSNKEAKCKAKA